MPNKNEVNNKTYRVGIRIPFFVVGGLFIFIAFMMAADHSQDLNGVLGWVIGTTALGIIFLLIPSFIARVGPIKYLAYILMSGGLAVFISGITALSQHQPLSSSILRLVIGFGLWFEAYVMVASSKYFKNNPSFLLKHRNLFRFAYIAVIAAGVIVRGNAR